MIEIVNEAQLRSLIAKRGLIETASFDAKRALGSNSKEIAKDIAAMSTDVGAIIPVALRYCRKVVVLEDLVLP